MEVFATQIADHLKLINHRSFLLVFGKRTHCCWR
uniref:Uncharacterized protein n=1 Tax=Nelumbo nucifera TaxID=4432 RepID=A0A822Z8U6_NELNU|nr:TPA_asm: hypothetical protein HUJ06_015795 [Nelumbo nucifera]